MDLARGFALFLLLGVAQGLFLALLLLTRRENVAANRILAGAMVAIAVVVYLMPFYLKSGPEKVAFVEHLMQNGAPLDVKIIEWLKLPHGAAYTLATFGVLGRYRRRLEENFSTLDRINLGWLRHILVGAMVIWAVAIVNFVLIELGFRLLGTDSSLAPLVLVVFIYTIGILHDRNPRIAAARGVLAAGCRRRLRKR